MSDNEFRNDYDDDLDFEDMSLSEREELLKNEARRRYVSRKEHAKKQTREQVLLTITKVLIATFVILIIMVYIMFNMISAKKDRREEGIEAFNQGKYEDAAKSFTESIEKGQWFSRKMDIDTYFYLGDTYMRLGRFTEAKEAYHYIQYFGDESDVKKAEPYMNISDAMLDVEDGNYDTAIETLKSEVDRGDSVAALYLGTCYEMMGDNKKMLESYEIYLKDNQLNSYLAYQISTYYLETGEIELAKAYIDSGLNADDEYRDKLLFNDVVYYEKILDFNSALSNAQALKEAYPDVEEYQKEYDFLYTRVNIDTTLSNGTTPEEGN